MPTIRALLALLVVASAARAAEPPGESDVQVAPERAPVARTFLYGDLSTVPAQTQAAVFSRFSYGAGDSPTRPFGANTATRGALLEVGGEVGLGRGVSVVAVGSQGQSSTGATAGGALLGVRFSLLSAAVPTQLVLAGGYLHQLDGREGAWARLLIGHDLGRARLQLTVHGEHLFAAGSDAMDVMVTAGAHYRLAGSFRVGVEYVGQDLEEQITSESEGGARHLLGPVGSLGLLGDRLSLLAGPAVVFGPEGTRLLGRAALGYSF